jgi:vitamin B12 transporter
MRIFFFQVLLVLSFAASAQTIVTGIVKDTKNHSVAAATLTIKDSYDGGIADSSGVFRFTTSETGEHILIVTAIGYKSNEEKLSLSGAEISLHIVLKEEINELKAVVITAGAFEASDKKRTTVLNSIDIATTASANADVVGAIKTLPGAQQVGESEGLFVRGGTAGESKTYIDGTLVNNFFFSSVPDIAQRGRFSPFLFKGTVFSAGGYSALYGQALSSALILESIDLPDQSSGTFTISPLGASLGYQKLTADKKTSWGASYAYAFLDLAYKVLGSKVEYYDLPEFHTAEANFRTKTSRSGMLKYYAYWSQSNLGLRQWSLDSTGYKDAFGLKNFNLFQNLSYRENLGAYWKLNAGVSYTNNKDNIEGSFLGENNNKELVTGFEYKNFLLDSRGNYFNGKVVVERRLHGLSALRAGAEYNYSNDNADYTLYTGLQYPNKVKENIVSAFAEGDVYLTNDIAAKIGGRMEHSSLLSKYNIAPRISLAYKLGKEGQASFAYGTFYQDPDRRYLPAIGDLNFTKATHYILQYQKVTSGVTFRAEAYYKKYDELLKTRLVNNNEVAVSTNGSGYAKGIEVFWRDKKSIRNFDYWVSYSFIDTRRDFLNYPYQLEPYFVARHTANVVVKKFVTSLKTQFNANYVIATGRPYYNIRYDYAINQFRIYDEGRTPAYKGLSLSVNYLPNVFKSSANKFTVFILSINNILGNDQISGYKYSLDGMRKQAIMPPTKTFIYVGAYISFGVDRRQDAINNNL